MRRLTLGDAKIVSLADAREAVRNAVRAIAKGIDPAEEKRDRREADTDAEFAKRYIDEYARPRGHDLRRTAATMMGSGGVSRLVLAKILNHADSGVTAIYDRATYDAEKRAALEWWAAKLDSIVKNEQGAKVLAFARAWRSPAISPRFMVGVLSDSLLDGDR